MISLLAVALAIQTVSAPEPAKAQRISEEIHYLHPYQRGVYSCSRDVSRQQSRIFDRRFGRRIEALKQKEAAILGPDPGYEIIAIGMCSPSRQVWSAGFAKALRQFDQDLTALEARYR